MATFLVTTTSDLGEDGAVMGDLAAEQADGDGLSLREAVVLANADDAVDLISFADGEGEAFAGGGTVALERGQLMLTSPLAIDGDLDDDGAPDVTLDAQGNSRVLLVQGPDTPRSEPSINVRLDGLVITGGVATAEEAVQRSPSRTSTDTGGGLVSDRADLELTASRVTDNAGGAAIYVAGRDSMTSIRGTVIDENDDTGILVQPNSGFAVLIIDASRVEHNGGAGVGTTQSTDVTISNSTITDNARCSVPACYGAGRP